MARQSNWTALFFMQEIWIIVAQVTLSDSDETGDGDRWEDVTLVLSQTEDKI